MDWLLGGNFAYLHSHFRTDSDTPGLTTRVNGDGRYTEFYLRWDRLKVIYGHWRGHNYSHESGDEYFRTDVMRLGTIHWDILLSPDFNLFFESTGYFIGNNRLGYSHFIKPTFTLQCAWHFGVPAQGWQVGEPSAPPAPDRCDTGL